MTEPSTPSREDRSLPPLLASASSPDQNSPAPQSDRSTSRWSAALQSIGSAFSRVGANAIETLRDRELRRWVDRQQEHDDEGDSREKSSLKTAGFAEDSPPCNGTLFDADCDDPKTPFLPNCRRGAALIAKTAQDAASAMAKQAAGGRQQLAVSRQPPCMQALLEIPMH